MRHDWIFDVLTDLLAYSRQNDLPALAHRVEDALQVARIEVEADISRCSAEKLMFRRDGRAN